ncbi:unnamed protein product [Cylicocyclus nassatus]|uniref:ATP-dependent RNA helicase n=1 Tax=Cylicocyclus nassatus TaxID=53992 RepID=A0AA36DU72_CYLNA|nr:unnamed protein product [Cylicocyclus nassatus]
MPRNSSSKYPYDHRGTGSYIFEFGDDQRRMHCNDFVFDMNAAMQELDYYSERQELRKRSNGKYLENDYAPSDRMEIRCQDLPTRFRKQSTLDFLQPCVARNVVPGRRHHIAALLPLQQYMIPLVLYEFNFLVMGPDGAGKTSGYLLPLVNKLVEFKEVELRGRRGPLALIITHTEDKLRHVKDLCGAFCIRTPLIRFFIGEEELDAIGGLSSTTVFDMVGASASTMVNALKKYQIPLKHLKFVVLEEFHLCYKDSDYMRNLIALKNLLTKNEVLPTFMYISTLVSTQQMFDKSFMKEMSCCKVAKIVAPPGIDDVRVAVLPCRSAWCHFDWTLKLLAGEGVFPKKTVVLANDPWTVHSIALRLSLEDVQATYVTHSDSLLEVEEAVRLWRTEEFRVIVADYKSLSEMDYGFVEMCVLFELPEDDFSLYCRRLTELSAKLNHRRRIYIMVNTELDLKRVASVINFLDDLDQAYPDFLQAMQEKYVANLRGTSFRKFTRICAITSRFVLEEIVERIQKHFLARRDFARVILLHSEMARRLSSNFGDAQDNNKQEEDFERFLQDQKDNITVSPNDKYDQLPLNQLEETLQKNLRKMGYQQLLPLQAYSAKILLSGHHLLVRAPTGSGKTAAFLIPAIQYVIEYHLHVRRTDYPLVLILGNTSNLMEQTYKFACQMAGYEPENRGERKFARTNVRIAGLYAGGSALKLLKFAKSKLEQEIVVATCGGVLRAIDLHMIDLSNLKLLIIDEADKMVDISRGFGLDVHTILSKIPEDVKEKLVVAEFSATFYSEDNAVQLSDLEKELFRGELPAFIDVPAPKGYITQRVIEKGERVEGFWRPNFDKDLSLLMGLIEGDLRLHNMDRGGPFKKSTVIFVERKITSNYLALFFQLNGYRMEPLNSDFTPKQNREVLRSMEQNEIQGVVATNKLSRGQDIPEVDHVIVYEMSQNFDDYKHRIGRTGRMGRGGRATVLFSVELDYVHIINLFEFMCEHDQIIPQWLYTEYMRCKQNMRTSLSMSDSFVSADSNISEAEESDDEVQAENIVKAPNAVE